MAAAHVPAGAPPDNTPGEMQAFANAVSHDLRAPLTIARNYTAILRRRSEQGLDDEGRRHLARIEDALGRMSGVMEDLLHLTMAAQADMEPRDIAIGEIASEVAAILREREPERRAEIVVDELALAYGDDRLIRVLLENLIVVAWRSSREGVIEFGTDLRGDDTVYFVRGGGAVPDFDGGRLDMAIASCVVRRHGGRAWVERDAQGARMCFTLADEG